MDNRRRAESSCEPGDKADEALARRRLEALEEVLVAGVVGDHQHEARRRLEQLARALDRQHAPIVGERMQHDGRVLARLDDLVEIADAAFPHRARQRPVAPARLAVADQMAADEIGRGEVVVAGDRGQRQTEPRGHVGDEARLAAAGRPLDQQRQAVAPGMLE